MANSNFIVQNGLTVGGTTIDATSGNISLPGGSYVNIGGTPLSTPGGSGTFSTTTTAVLNSTSANLTTAVATNFSSGNAQITGGSLAASTVTGTVATANVSLYDNISATSTNATFYPQVTDKASGNVATYSVSSFNINPSTGVLSATQFSGTGNFSTAVATNFSSGNAVITGGSATGLTNTTATTAQATNFSSGNAQITGGSLAASTVTGTVATANVSLYDSIATTTTNAVFYPQVMDKASGNVSGYSSATFTINPSTGALYTTGLVASTVSAATIGNSGATLTGTIQTAAQTNITSVGTLTGLTVTGATITANITAGGITSNGTMQAATVNAATIGNTNAVLTGGLSTASQPNVTTLAGLTSFGTIGATTSVLGNLAVGGNLTVTGQSVSIGASTLSITDPIININTPQDLTPLTSATTADIGLKFHYYDTADSAGFAGRTVSDGYFTYWAKGTDSANVFTGTVLGTIKSGAVWINNTTAATGTTSSTAGALYVAGGMGVAGAAYHGSVYDNGNRVVTTVNTTAGTGISLSSQTTTGPTTAVTITNSGVTSAVAGTGISVSGATGAVTITNTGATSIVAGTAISVSGATGAVTVNNTGVTSAVAGTGVSVSGATGAVTVSIGQAIGTSATPTFAGITVPSITHSGTSGTGDIGASGAAFGTVWATATSAKYADLAENYQGDRQYNPGTVLMFGGDAEVTLADADTTRVAGVVSTNPAHLMNGQLMGPTVVALALQGRVPCQVIGPVQKGDLLVSAGFGYAKTNNSAGVGQVIGKALENYPMHAKGVVEVVVGRF